MLIDILSGTDKMTQPNIRIFSKVDCPYCDSAKSLLISKGFNYTEIIIGSDLTREQFVEKFPNVKTVPYIIIGNNHVGGYKQLVEFIGE